MAKRSKSGAPAVAPKPGKPSSLLDTRVVYCGLRRAQSSRDHLEQLQKLPDACVETRVSIYVDPPFNSNRTTYDEGEVFRGETKEKRSFADRHASTQALRLPEPEATSRTFNV